MPTWGICSAALPGQFGYHRRLRAAAGLITAVTRPLAADTSWWADDVWVADSAPVERGRSKKTVRRSELAGWAEYGYRASHARYFWGLRLHLVATLGGLPVAFALTGAKAGERQTLLQILAAGPALAGRRPGQTLTAGRHYYGTDFEAALAAQQVRLLRPAPAKVSPNGQAASSSTPCGRPSSRSTRPSKPSLTWNATAATLQPEWPCESFSASWR